MHAMSERISGIYGFLLKGSFPSAWYVGQSVDVWGRRKGHIRNARYKTTRFHRAVAAKGFEAFEFVILEECPPSGITDREAYWIERLGALDIHGFNVRPAMNCKFNRTVTDATRARMRAASKKIWEKPGYRERYAKMAKGRKMSPETRAKMSAAAKGKPKSKEHAANIGACKKGKKIPQSEAMRAYVQSLKGKKITGDRLDRIRAVAKAKEGIPRDPKVIEKIKAAKIDPVIIKWQDGTEQLVTSTTIASELTGVPRYGILRRIKDGRPVRGGGYNSVGVGISFARA